MLPTSVLYSCGAHLGLMGLLWLFAQSPVDLPASGQTAPIVAQIVSAQVLDSQIAAVEKRQKPPVQKIVAIKPASPKKPVVKPRKKPPVAPKPVAKATPPLPVFTAQDREQFLQHALDAEEAAYEAALREEMARIGHEIKRRVSAHWLIPAGRSHDLTCQVKIQLDSDGQVQQVAITRSSGNRAFDDAAMVAVRRSSPLPMPQDARLRSQFRDILLTLSPDGVA